MKRNNDWLPILLTLLILPGMGHLYLKKKVRGVLFAGLSLLIVLAGLMRYMSVVFALANVRSTPRTPIMGPVELLIEAWRLDHTILLSFLVALGLVWFFSLIDLLFLLKEGREK